MITSPTSEHSYTILYYQFIKHAFGFGYMPASEMTERVGFFFDEMPIPAAQKSSFVNYLVHLFNDTFKIRLAESDLAEVASQRHLPMQVMDLVLGAMCFRLNRKHLLKNPQTGRRGARTIKREKLYKYIYEKVRVLTRRQFNIGVSTGGESRSEWWSAPYLHWSFTPSEDN